VIQPNVSDPTRKSTRPEGADAKGGNADTVALEGLNDATQRLGWIGCRWRAVRVERIGECAPSPALVEGWEAPA
jgi:hypothetical protein